MESATSLSQGDVRPVAIVADAPLAAYSQACGTQVDEQMTDLERGLAVLSARHKALVRSEENWLHKMLPHLEYCYITRHSSTVQGPKCVICLDQPV